METFLHSALAQLSLSSLPQQLVNGILLGSIYALIALGYTMVYGVLRLINFAHGEVYMLGAYVALFTSYLLGFTPEATRQGTVQSNVINLGIMLVASMAVCAVVGVLIERFAYRPMRNHSRIASLITAIGVSLLLQFGGALFLPNSPPPSISEQVNPFRTVANDPNRRPVIITLKPQDKQLAAKAAALKPASERAKQEFDAYLQRTGESRFAVSDAGRPLRDAALDTQAAYDNAQRAATGSAVYVTVQIGQLIMLGTSLLLMGILRWLVMKTSVGRAMRAVSHDFDSASLMGVNVNRIVTITFIIGSALAGAGAMMTATFYGTPLTTFYGLQPGVKAFVAAVLGGIGNIPGAVLGGLLMGVAENLVVWAGYSGYRDAIAFVILIVVLLFRPGGILGSAKVEKV